MQFIKIDLENWSRKETYLRFIDNNPCTYSMTVNLDITDFLAQVKAGKLSFFSSFLFVLSNAVNMHKEFRMAFDDNKNLGYYPYSNPCYTIFHEQTETFTTAWTEYSADFTQFMQNYKSDMEKYKNNCKNSKPMNTQNYFNLSAIPWTSFTGFNLNIQKGYDYLAPIFTIGKYFENNEKILMPLAIQVHHAVCDGYHVSKFTDNLQNKLNSFKV